MKRFVEGEDRRQVTLLPECLDDYVAPDNPVRIVEAFVDELDLVALGFACGYQRQRDGPPITPRPCSRSTSTAISTVSRPAAAWNARPSATSS